MSPAQRGVFLVRSTRHFRLLLATAGIALIAGQAHAQMQTPGAAPAQGPDAPQTPADPAEADPQASAPIVPDAEFDKALPPLSGDLNAPLEPMTTEAAPTAAPAPAQDAAQQPIGPGALPPAPAPDPALTQPLEPLAAFDSTPLQSVADPKADETPDIRYASEVRGLDPLGLSDEFNSLSALRDGKGKADNATQVAARGREDEQLAVRLMKSLGYYDGTAISTIENVTGEKQQLKAIVSATPGQQYKLGTITVQAQPTTPSDLVRRELPLRTGDPIEAARVQGAEANVSLKLPQQGYPFVKVGDRDILLDERTARGDYTLPVDTGPRSSFGALRTEGDPVFDLKHLNVFPRFDQGQLYDNRKADDLREALVATGLFNGVGVQPVRTGTILPDGTEQVDLMVRQTRGPAKSLAGGAGFQTGQGVTVEGTFTNRNRFPPEGALILGAIAGTQQQGVSGTFRRQNAGKRDRTVTLVASALRANYDAFEAFTGTLSGRISYDSTPIWQKKFTYAYGFELVGTNESVFDFADNDRVRRTYGVLALPGQVQFDTSDDLLNPTRGYRLKLSLSPETSVQGSVRPYGRSLIEGTAYYPVSDKLVIAGRVRAGSIFGIARDDIAPSRRYYGGGGGSVRGYGFQRLGPLEPESSLVPDDKDRDEVKDLRPIGGRSLNEFSIEARYRFGNFGIVPFLDAGNTYESSLPDASDLRFGAGIGGRFYTNFGPMRVDVATPLNPRPGDAKVALYISIGQAF